MLWRFQILHLWADTCKSSRCLDHNRLWPFLLTISRGRWTALLWSGVPLQSLLPSDALGLFPFPWWLCDTLPIPKESAVVKANTNAELALSVKKIGGK